MKYYVYPWKQGSRSAKVLSEALDGRVIKLQNSKYRHKNFKRVINWGSSSCPYPCLNPPEAVSVVSNKLSAFSLWSDSEDGPRVPGWTPNKDEAKRWITDGLCKRVVARTILTGHSGSGIVIVDKDSLNDLPDAPLYVEYIPKDREYRVHVFNGEVIDVQRKIRDPDREPTNWQVRNHVNGFIFTRGSSDGSLYRDTVSLDIKEQAIRAVSSAGLDFGAVDIAVNKEGTAFVLEVNSSPGIEGQTVEVYRDAILKL